MTSSNILIRIAVSSDVTAIRSCARAAYQKYIVRMNQEPAPMLADFDLQVSEGLAFVAMNNDELVGYVVYYPVADSIHLENVAVLPSHTGMGIGRQLIQHVEDQAIARGAVGVDLYTNEMMHENLAMYPKLGYRETERKTQSGFNRVFFNKLV